MKITSTPWYLPNHNKSQLCEPNIFIMKNNLILLFTLFQLVSSAQEGPRQTFFIPDVEGYKVLKADLHMHTVFSDGQVWPDFRVNEAWQEGLDVIAITDHIEYRPNKAEINGDHNRSVQIAREAGLKAGILVIAGSEITRKMPPGHFNALFLTDANKLDVPDWMEAFREARRQGAFIFWNHPGWKAQQPDSARWMPEHQMLFDSGYMHGIEVANYNEWYPAVMRWALRHNLTMLGNSDIHGGIYQQYAIQRGEHRPLSLVFATEKSLESVKEALFARRTLVLFDGHLYGTENWLAKLFHAVVKVTPCPAASGEGRITMLLENQSDLNLTLQPTPESIAQGVIYPVSLPARSEVYLSLRLKNEQQKGKSNHPVLMKVEEWHPEPGCSLPITLQFSR